MKKLRDYFNELGLLLKAINETQDATNTYPRAYSISGDRIIQINEKDKMQLLVYINEEIRHIGCMIQSTVQESSPLYQVLLGEKEAGKLLDLPVTNEHLEEDIEEAIYFLEEKRKEISQKKREIIEQEKRYFEEIETEASLYRIKKLMSSEEETLRRISNPSSSHMQTIRKGLERALERVLKTTPVVSFPVNSKKHKEKSEIYKAWRVGIYTIELITEPLLDKSYCYNLYIKSDLSSRNRLDETINPYNTSIRLGHIAYELGDYIGWDSQKAYGIILRLEAIRRYMFRLKEEEK